MLRKFTESMRERVQMFVAEMQAETGLSVVEMILILVVIIALVLIFKTQLTTLVNDIFEKITSESAGIEREKRGDHSIFKPDICTDDLICNSNSGKCICSGREKSGKAGYGSCGVFGIWRISEGIIGGVWNFCGGGKL